jgi:ZIP family zinc transporter
MSFLTGPFLLALALTAAAGLSAFAGAALGCLDEIRGGVLSNKAKNAIIAFGGGALIGAVGLLLVPHGLDSQPVWLAAGTFVAGGAAALVVDRALQRSGTPASQLVALNLDFIPEAVVVGAVITQNRAMALFLAAVMIAQNLPEGFNAYREVRKSHGGFIRSHILRLMLLCIVIGPIAATLGYLVFTLESAVLGSVMTFFAGGILYLVFEDVAPEAKGNGEWMPAMGAVAGFMVALIGSGITG